MRHSFVMLIAVATILHSARSVVAAGVQAPSYSIQSTTTANVGLDFGNIVATDGTLIAVSKTGFYDQVSATYVYDAATGANKYQLAAADGPYSLTFGGSVALDGNRLLAGTGCVLCAGFPRTTVVMMFDSQSGSTLGRLIPNDSSELDGFGSVIATDGQRALVSAPRANTSIGSGEGAAYLFDMSTQTQLRKFNAQVHTYYAEFGHAVALDGNRAIVGAPYFSPTVTGTGAVFIYDTDTGDQIKALSPPDLDRSNSFGNAVGIYNGLAVVGDPGWDSPQTYGGAVHFFDMTTGSLVKTLTPVDENGQRVGGGFGTSLSISDHYALIGAPSATDGTGSNGYAYLFDLDTYEQLAIFASNPNSAIGDIFGYVVSMSGGVAVVGAPYSRNRGEVHVFAVPEPASVGPFLLSLACLMLVAQSRRPSVRRSM